MTFGNIHLKNPKSKRLDKTKKQTTFIVHGQGVFLFYLNECFEDMPICMIQIADNDGDEIMSYKESINVYFTPVNAFALKNGSILSERIDEITQSNLLIPSFMSNL